MQLIREILTNHIGISSSEDINDLFDKTFEQFTHKLEVLTPDQCVLAVITA